MTNAATVYLKERGDSYARDAAKFRDARRLGQPITDAVQDTHWAEVYQIIADELRKCAFEIDAREADPVFHGDIFARIAAANPEIKPF